MPDIAPLPGRTATILRQDAHGGEQEAPLAERRAGVDTHKRSLFINEIGTGTNVSDRGKLEPGTRSDEVDFPPELKKKYETFLGNYINRLGELSNARIHPDPGVPALGIIGTPGRSLWDRILEDPQRLHEHDAEIMAILSKDSVSESGEYIGKVADEDAVREFMQSDRGKVIAHQLMEYQTTLEVAALGLHAATNVPAERRFLAQPNFVHLGIDYDQGRLNNIFNDHVGPWWHHRVMTIDGRVRDDWQGGVLGFLRDIQRGDLVIGGAMAADVGVGFALAYGALAGAPAGLGGMAVGAAIGTGAYLTGIGVSRGIKPGLSMDLRQCTATFAAIQGSVVESEYVRAVSGINVTDYNIVGPNNIQLAPVAGGAPQTRRNVEQIKKDVMEKLYTRMEFFAALKVRRETVDALPSQAQYWAVPGPTQGTSEQTGAKWEERIADRFNTAAIGGHNPANLQQSFERYVRAQREILLEDITEYIRNKKAMPIEQLKDRRLSTLRAKRDARTAPEGQTPALQAERTRQFTARKNLYTEAKTLLGTDAAPGDQQVMNTYREAQRSIQNTRNNAQREFTVSDVAGITTQITNRENNLQIDTAVPPPGSIAHQEGLLNAAMQAAMAPLLAPLPPNTPVRIIEGIEARIRTQFGVQLVPLQRERTRIEGEITRLRELSTTIRTNQDTLAENENATRNNTELFAALQRDYQQVIGDPAVFAPPNPNAGIDALLTAAGVPAAGLSDANFANLSIDQLLTRINTASTTGAAIPPPVGPLNVGWPEAQNRRPERRRQVLHAMIEARARIAEVADPARTPARIGNYNALIAPAPGWGLTENQLRTMSEAEIRIELGNRAVALGIMFVPAAPVIQDAMQEAQNRLQVRADAFTQVTRDLDRWIEEQDDQIAGVDFGVETRRLNLTIALLDRQGDIYSGAGDIRPERARFLNNTVPVAADADWATYSQQEREAVPGIGGAGPTALPRGYYEIMDLMFDYKNRQNRGEYFQQIYQFFPPDRLSRVLNDSLGLALVGAPPALNVVLGAINARMAAGVPIGSANIRRAFADIINAYYNEANTL